MPGHPTPPFPGTRLGRWWPTALTLLAGLWTGAADASVGEDARTSSPVWDQPGWPIVQDFTSRDYTGTSYANIFQRENGLIYYHAGGRVVEFDGAHHRTWTVSEIDDLGYIAPGPEGVIMVHRANDFGRLVPVSPNDWRYQSLTADFGPDDRNWESGVTLLRTVGDTVYFSTLRKLLRWRAGRGEVLFRDNQVLHCFFLIGPRLFLSHSTQGLLEFRDGLWEPIPGGQTFVDARHQAITGAAPDATGGVILVVDQRQLFRFDGTTLEPYPVPPNLLSEGDLKGDLCPLGNGDLALSTGTRGLLLLDRAGRLRAALNNTTATAGNYAGPLFQDDQDGLWTLTQNGLRRLEINPALTIFDQRAGINSAIHSLTRLRGRMVLRLASELAFSPDPDNLHDPRFSPGPLIGSLDGSLAVTDDLYFINQFRLYRYREGRTESLLPDHKVYGVLPSETHPDRLYLRELNRLTVMEQHEGQWRLSPWKGNLSGLMISVTEEDEAHIWLETGFGTVSRLDLTGPHPLLSEYTTAHGLPPEWISPMRLAGQVVFRTRTFIYRFDRESQRFLADPDLTALFPMPLQELWRTLPDPTGSIWISAPFRSGIMEPRPEGGYDWHVLPLGMLNPIRLNAVLREGDIAWLGTNKGLVRYDLAADRAAEPPVIPVLLRGVGRLGTTPPLYRGVGPAPAEARLPYQRTALRFEFAQPDFHDPERILYQYRLLGQLEEWSAWSTETQADFTNLAPGRYEFQVRARDHREHLSPVTTFPLTIIPPWYRTLWAYGALVGVLGFGIYGIVSWRQYALRAENRRLETLVRARTAEAEAAHRARNRLLANLNQESLNPVQGMIGLATVLLQTRLEPEQSSLAATLRATAEGLLELIHDIIRLARLEAETEAVSATDYAPRQVLDGCLEHLSGRLRQRVSRLLLTIEDSVPPLVHGDASHLRHLVQVLCRQALRQPGEDPVALRVRGERPAGTDSCTGLILELVRPAGLLTEEQREVLLGTPVRETSPDLRRFGDHALGLSICRHLLELAGGSLELHPPAGPAQTVRMRLPVQPARHSTDPEETVWRQSLWGGRALLAGSSREEVEALRHQATHLGLVCQIAENPESALQALHGATASGNPVEIVIVALPPTPGDWDPFLAAVQTDPACGQPDLLLIGEDDAGPGQGLAHVKRLRRPVRTRQFAGAVAGLFAQRTRSA